MACLRQSRDLFKFEAMAPIKLTFYLVLCSYVCLGQSWNPTQRLVCPDTAKNSNFGKYLALSDEFLVVGAERDEIGNEEDSTAVWRAGSVYIYRKENGSFQFWQKLVAPKRASNALYGSSLALLDDYLFVGAFNYFADGNLGRTYAYTLDQDRRWILSQEIYPSDSTIYFGQGLDAQHGLLAIGAWVDTVGKPGDTVVPAGAVYIYELDSIWRFKQKLTTTQREQYDLFGLSLDLEDSLLLVGATGKESGQGAAYLFKRTSDTFTQIQSFASVQIPRVSTKSGFGHALKIIGDWVFISAPGHDYGQSWSEDLEDFGVVHGYQKNGSNFQWKHNFYHNTSASKVRYGTTVDGSEDFLFVGSPAMNEEGGVVYKTDNFIATGRLNQPLLRPGDAFGTSLSLHQEVLAVGSPQAKRLGGGVDSLEVSGAVYLFRNGTSSAVSTPVRRKAKVYPNPTVGRCTVRFQQPISFIECRNVLGELLPIQFYKEGERTVSIDLSECNDGLYFISNKGETAKVIVQSI